MEFADVYKPKHSAEVYKPKFGYETLYTNKELHLDMNEDAIEEIHSRSDRYKRFVSSFDEYKKSNLDLFNKCTEAVSYTHLTLPTKA